MAATLVSNVHSVTALSPTAPSALSATALDYNQVVLTYAEPSGSHWGYDIDISWDAGVTWHWWRRVPTAANTLSWTGRTYSGTAIMAGFAAANTYHFRMRTVTSEVDGETYGDWSAATSVVTPAYRTASGGGVTVYEVTDQASWNVARVAVKPGDFIDIAAGTTINTSAGYAILEIQSGGTDGFITIRTNDLQHTPYVRAAAADIANFGGFTTAASNEPYFIVAFGQDKICFESILFESTLAVNSQYGILVGRQGVGGLKATEASTLLETPSHLEFHGCLFINDVATNEINGFIVNDGHFSVIQDCVMNYAHRVGIESKAILIANGAVKWIGNTEYASSSIHCLCGGQATSYDHDVTCQVFYRNYTTRPAAWATDSDIPVKNGGEWKNGTRVVMSACVWEHSWSRAQAMNLLITPRSFGDNDAGCQYFYIHHNIIQEAHGGIQLDNWDNASPSDELLRYRTAYIAFEDNLFDLIQDVQWGTQTFEDSSFGLEFAGTTSPAAGTGHDIYVRHNTFINRLGTAVRNPFCIVSGGNLGWEAPIVIQDNIVYGALSDGTVATKGGGPAAAKTVLDAMFGAGGYTWRNNAQYTENPPTDANTKNDTGPNDFPVATMPGCQFFDGIAGILFTDAAGRDYTLQGGSPLVGQASDGGDIGADIVAINTATAHTIDGDWT